MFFLFLFFLLAGTSCDLILTARNLKSLEETKSMISSRAPEVCVEVVAGDMADMSSIPSLCSRILQHVNTAKHRVGLLVNNAGSMNDFQTPFLSLRPEQIQDYMGLNCTSMMVLTTHFLKAFPQPGQRIVVNITSLLARAHYPGFTLYSLGRVARESFMSSIKVECPDVRLLNYSAGPCDTEMFQKMPKDSEIVKMVDTLLTPRQSIQKMMGQLVKDEFENGSVVDYFDI